MLTLGLPYNYYATTWWADLLAEGSDFGGGATIDQCSVLAEEL